MSSEQSVSLLSGTNVVSPAFLRANNKVLPLGGNGGKDAIPRFLFAVLVLLPFWLLILVPAAIITYPFKFIMKSKKAPAKVTSPANSAPLVPNSPVVPLASRTYDLIIYGATGFTGKLCAEYVARQYGTTIRWAVAGRRREALTSLVASLSQKVGRPELVGHVGVVIADAHDQAALKAMVESTRAVATTAGPFALSGTPLVEQCARAGTGYCDITGESDWVRGLIDKYDGLARQTGARIVNFCGHDCVPWDLAIYKAAEKLRKDHGEALVKVDCYDEIVGSASGGTMATLFHSLDGRQRPVVALPFDPLMKTRSDNNAVDADSTAPSQSTLAPKNQSFLGYNKRALLGKGAWVGPFVMAMVMANCVRRSNAVNNYSNGGKLQYHEAMVYPNFMAGVVDLTKMVIFGTCMATPVLLEVLKRVVVQPGQGPSEADMDAGFLKVTVQATGDKGTQVAAAIYFPTDPGYRDTARMLVESALTIALDGDKINVGGGVYTPAACQNQALLDRLCATGTQFQAVTLDKNAAGFSSPRAARG